MYVGAHVRYYVQPHRAGGCEHTNERTNSTELSSNKQREGARAGYMEANIVSPSLSVSLSLFLTAHA